MLPLSCSKKAASITKRNKLKNKCEFYCLNCLCAFRAENKLKWHKKVCTYKNFCGVT